MPRRGGGERVDAGGDEYRSRVKHWKKLMSRIKDPRSVHNNTNNMTITTTLTTLTPSHGSSASSPLGLSVSLSPSPSSSVSVVLVSAGLGMLGAAGISVGVYVAAGQVVKDLAGPAAVLSVIVALIVTLVAGCVYAEFRSRVPRVYGTSSYEYMYCLAGEAFAFLTGWIALLQNIALTACLARGASQNIDSLLQFRLLNLTATAGGTLDVLESHVDVLAFVLVLLVMVVCVSTSYLPPTRVSLALHAFVGVVLLFVLLLGAFKTEFKARWGDQDVFFQKGAEGIFTGAASIICVFTAYEYIVTGSDFSVGSSSTLQSTLCKSSALATGVTFLLVLSVTSLISLLAPVTDLHTEVPFVEAFTIRGLPQLRFLIAIPAILVLLHGLLLTFTRLVKLTYDMACDGLLFALCHHTVPGRNTPIFSIILFGLLSSVHAVVFNLTTLTQLTSFCTLAVSLLVAVVVLALKHQPSIQQSPRREPQNQSNNQDSAARGSNILINQGSNQGNQGSRRSVTESRAYGTSQNCDSATVTMENNPISNISPAITDARSSNPFRSSNSYTSIDGSSSVERPQYLGITSIETSTDPRLTGTNTTDPRPTETDDDDELLSNSSTDTDIDDVVEEYKIQSVLMCKMGTRLGRIPTEASSVQAKVAITLLLIWFFCAAVIVTRGWEMVRAGNVTMVTVLGFFLFLTLCSLVHLLCQPRDSLMDGYYVFVCPLGAVLPLLAMLMCVVLMLLLPITVWIVALVWMLIGLLVYLLHGVHNSVQQSTSTFSFSSTVTYERVPDEQQTLIPPSHHPLQQSQDPDALSSRPPRLYHPRSPPSLSRSVTSIQADPIIPQSSTTSSSHSSYQQQQHRSRDHRRPAAAQSCDQKRRHRRSRDHHIGSDDNDRGGDGGGGGGGHSNATFDILQDEEERSHHRRNDDPMIIIARE